MKQIEIKHFNGDFDALVIRDVPREYRGVTSHCKGAVVLDIGGHIGCFAALALNHGARKVIIVEPGTPSIRLMRKNLKNAGSRVIIHHAGITADKNQKEITLRYLSHAQSMAGAKTITRVIRTEWNGIPFKFEKVPTVQFSELMARHKPSVLKIDCEGVEYALFESLDTMPLCVKAVIVEWHNVTPNKDLRRYIEARKKLKRWGFRPEKSDNLKMNATRQLIRPIAWTR